MDVGRQGLERDKTMIIIEMGIDGRALGNAGEERPSGWYSEWADSKTKEIVRSDKANGVADPRKGVFRRMPM